jgi:hypothetical protein
LLDRNNGRTAYRQLFELRCAPLAGTALARHGLFQAQDDKFINLNRKIVAGGAVGNNDIRSTQTTQRCLAA